MENVVSQTYEEWHHCITVECGITLTSAFIEERIASMQDDKDFRTSQFIQLYGPQHHQKVLAWFQQAKEEIK